MQLTEFRGKVRSWTNFWRIDDPIGARVDVVSGDFIDNRALGRGGHIDYWREDEVQRHIHRLLEPSLAGQAKDLHQGNQPKPC